MGLKRAAVVILAMNSCAITFPYHHYGLEAESYKGKLLGPKPKDDLELSVCQPDGQNKAKCSVLLTEEFRRLKDDYLETKQLLKECQGAH